MSERSLTRTFYDFPDEWSRSAATPGPPGPGICRRCGRVASRLPSSFPAAGNAVPGAGGPPAGHAVSGPAVQSRSDGQRPRRQRRVLGSTPAWYDRRPGASSPWGKLLPAAGPAATPIPRRTDPGPSRAAEPPGRGAAAASTGVGDAVDRSRTGAAGACCLVRRASSRRELARRSPASSDGTTRRVTAVGAGAGRSTAVHHHDLVPCSRSRVGVDRFSRSGGMTARSPSPPPGRAGRGRPAPAGQEYHVQRHQVTAHQPGNPAGPARAHTGPGPSAVSAEPPPAQAAPGHARRSGLCERARLQRGQARWPEGRSADRGRPARRPAQRACRCRARAAWLRGRGAGGPPDPRHRACRRRAPGGRRSAGRRPTGARRTSRL